ncbi:response regulator, partial [Staphylococcus aureus]|uniref:response regulator n=1 Tax=Staphylococcus aureus TaxID=1280 RepID=UPI00210A54BE
MAYSGNTGKQTTGAHLHFQRMKGGVGNAYAEDQNMLRQAMVQLIKLHGDFEILADTDNGLDAMKLIEEYNTNVVILAIEMPGMTGLEVLAEIRKKHLNIKVIIVKHNNELNAKLYMRI